MQECALGSEFHRQPNNYTNIYHSIQVSLGANLEGDSSTKQLIGKDSDVPDVNLVGVFLPLDYLWGGVYRGSTLCVPHQRTMNSPSEIA